MADTGKAFDALDPKKPITDPDGVGAQGGGRFPAHLHRLVPEATDTSVIVAWKGKMPIHNEFAEAGDPAALDALLADGWSETPVLEASAKVRGASKKADEKG